MSCRVGVGDAAVVVLRTHQHCPLGLWLGGEDSKDVDCLLCACCECQTGAQELVSWQPPPMHEILLHGFLQQTMTTHIIQGSLRI